MDSSAPHTPDSSWILPLEDIVSLAFDPQSRLSYFERVGLILWLGGYESDGFGRQESLA